MKNKLVFFLFGFLLTGCSVTRTLDEGQVLYKKTTIEVDAQEKDKSIEKDLKDIPEPKPNQRIFGVLPLRLWFYNLAGDSVPDKGFRHWVQTKLGRPPVIYKDYFVSTTETELRTALQNKGYFNPTINSEKKTKGRKIEVTYNVDVSKPYRINKITYPEPKDSLTSYILLQKQESLIDSGSQFNLDVLIAERERISKRLKNEGFYYFAANHMLFELDTTKKKDKLVDVELVIKDDAPDRIRNVYYLNNIYLYHNYNVFSNQKIKRDTTLFNGIYHLYDDTPLTIRKDILNMSVALKSNQRYSNEDYSITINKLTGLGIYKFVNIEYTQSEDDDSSKLNSHIYLTQSKKQYLRLKFEAVTKSNDYSGPGINLGFNDRNTFKGAEQFMINLDGRFETQLSKKDRASNSYEVGINTELSIPRFITPFFDANKYLAQKYTPQTRIRAGYSYLDRGKLFTINRFNLSYGYKWNETKDRSHEINVVSIDFLEAGRISDQLSDNYIIKRNFREQFIFSLNYNYTISELQIQKGLNSFFSTSAEFAGNTISLLDELINSGAAPDKNSKVFGTVYSQYAKFSADYRLYYNFHAYNKLAGRVFMGLGIPYGNSRFLPYNKQFYSGGISSIRAFPSRSVGPGTYMLPDSLQGRYRLEQTGDIKLEINLEYRFSIYKFFKGAVFADAGNVWLLRADAETPGGEFKSSTFLNQLAVGTGAGIRLDASFFVLRLDLAFPLRIPSMPKNDRWVYDDIDFTSKAWRRDNLVFNLAIGYPF